LLLEIVASSHFKIIAAEHYAVLIFCGLLHRCTETLQMLEEAYDLLAMKKIQVCKWHKHFCDGFMSITARASGDLQLQNIAKTWSMYAVLCKVTDESVFRRYW
jgi:hypothetical protein